MLLDTEKAGNLEQITMLMQYGTRTGSVCTPNLPQSHHWSLGTNKHLPTGLLQATASVSATKG